MHKRAGHGDPTEHMHRLWMLGALEKRSSKKPRRLGVRPEMLKWISRALCGNEENPSEDLDAQVGSACDVDATMLKSALLTVW